MVELNFVFEQKYHHIFILFHADVHFTLKSIRQKWQQRNKISTKKNRMTERERETDQSFDCSGSIFGIRGKK